MYVYVLYVSGKKRVTTLSYQLLDCFVVIQAVVFLSVLEI